MSRDECLEFLTEGTRTAKVATVRPDGRPHVAPVWFVVRDDHVVFTTWHQTVKAENLSTAPAVALTVDLEEPPYAFVLVEGTAQVQASDDELVAVATAIGARYMGVGQAEAFGQRNGVPGEWVVRVPLTRVMGRHEMTG